MHVKRKETPIQQTLAAVQHKLPPSLRGPFMTAVRAYGFAWALTTVPALVAALIKVAVGMAKQPKAASFAPLRRFFLQTVPRILHGSVFRNGLPWLLTGALASPAFVSHFLKKTAAATQTDKQARRTHQWVDSHQALVRMASVASSMWVVRRMFPKFKTMEFTFFALVRAFDIGAHRAAANPAIRAIVPSYLFDHGTVIVFTIACTEIMFSWFYAPSRLPSGYSRWITKMAEMDVRLLEALRKIRSREWIYGEDTGINDLLGNYCLDIGLPYEMGLPSRGRIPCTVVHGGQAWGCEVNALTRFSKGFTKVFFLYLMVHGMPPLMFKRQKLCAEWPGSAVHILKSTVRSSAFLATFISSIWYTICLTRTRIGHQVLGADQTRLDDTLGPLLGSMACGLSLFIENGRRRGEMALYVVPRALFSVMDRLVAPWYHKGRTWEPHVAEALETIAFAASMATILDAMFKDKTQVRSSVRGLLSWLMKDELKQHAAAANDDQPPSTPLPIDTSIAP